MCGLQSQPAPAGVGHTFLTRQDLTCTKRESMSYLKSTLGSFLHRSKPETVG